MKYTIKVDHPINQFILEEIESSYHKYKDNIGIVLPLQIDKPMVSQDIYGTKFNSNNQNVSCINVQFYLNKKTDNPPKIIDKNIIGYNNYLSSCNTCLKLKTFLEKHPQWESTIDIWKIPIIEEKKQAWYSGHNEQDRTASIRLPNNNSIRVKMPDDLKQKDFLDWVTKEADEMTLQYYREKELNKVLNIKKEQVVYVDGIWFYYNYYDGKVEVYDVSFARDKWLSFVNYKNIMGLFTPTTELYDKLKQEIESGDIMVKEVIFT